VRFGSESSVGSNTLKQLQGILAGKKRRERVEANVWILPCFAKRNQGNSVAGSIHRALGGCL
jgi:hypothetical protein